jgi:hypothetical protein
MNVDAIAKSPTVLLAFSVDVGDVGDPDRLNDDGEVLTQFNVSIARIVESFVS